MPLRDAAIVGHNERGREMEKEREREREREREGP
jgi:hypothetical protein